MSPSRLALFCFVVVMVTATVVRAEPSSVEAPKIASGDTWTYENTKESRGKWQQTRDSITVERVSKDAIFVSVKAVGSDHPPGEQMIGSNWSRSRNVNGRQTMVNEPVVFPLKLGKAWSIDYTEANPNRAHTREQVHLAYEAKDWEEITVPAGTFKALKVEADGDWAADVPASTNATTGSHTDASSAVAVGGVIRNDARTLTGHLYKAFWYVPELERWAKSVEEVFDPNGIRSERITAVLTSYNVKGMGRN